MTIILRRETVMLGRLARNVVPGVRQGPGAEDVALADPTEALGLEAAGGGCVPCCGRDCFDLIALDWRCSERTDRSSRLNHLEELHHAFRR